MAGGPSTDEASRMLSSAVIFVRRAVAQEPAHSAVTVGGLRYSVNNAWILHPRRSVDANVAAGLPARDARARHGRLLYAVFVGVTNTTERPRRMVSDLALRDTRNRDYAPVRMARRNRFAYAPTVVAGGSQLPAPGSPAERDVSADGLLLVFRTPSRPYDDGPLQLVLHDPSHPGSTRTVQTR
jgi:hypothetical protein